MAAINDQLCELCLCCASIEIESTQKYELIKNIRKYLRVTMEPNSVFMCRNCYHSLESFHEFYEGVHSAQKKFHLLLVGDRSWIRKSISTQTDTNETEAENSEIFPNEPIVIIKELSSVEPVKEPKQRKSVRKGSSQIKEPSELEKKMMGFYSMKCEKCDEDEEFTSFKMLSRHYRNVHNSRGYIKCCKRNIPVQDKSYLKSHMLKHLDPDTCRCKICGKQLSSAIRLKHHMILHKPDEERPFQCSICGKRFCNKNDLKNHDKSIHLPENEREDCICDVCGKVFQKTSNLKSHQLTVHLQERQYLCELCAKCFSTQSGLQAHMNNSHNTRGPIQCQECHKWLKNEYTLQKHRELHQNNSYPCSKCSKVCNSSTSLRSHMIKHSEERPHSCVVCAKSFKTKRHLKEHSALHSGGNHIKCPFCLKTYANMSNFYSHRKRVHSNEKSKNLKEEVGTVIKPSTGI